MTSYWCVINKENGNSGLPKKTKKKLSQRPLKRWLQFSVEIGPYGNGTAQRYILWTSELPRGKHDRFIAVVQRVTRPGHLGDHVHNPVLFQKIARMRDTQDDEYIAKYAYQQAKKHLWLVCKQVLEKATRPMMRFSYGQAGQWDSFEPGMATDTLGAWRPGDAAPAEQLPWLRGGGMTDEELIGYLGQSSTNPDDVSIVERYRILHWLRSKPEPTRTQLKWIDILERINREELDFLHAPTSYRISHERPCFPKHHWPQEPLLLGRQRREETNQLTRND